ncbi:Hint domain-containing protein [Pseudosulfitobacter koreensis]|uniref:Hint domain-containing protein n=1 Tax=Pseudosulfitobacter koreensis TaxID=2968472 RepID=A0ABT1Z014_9RHOB|nr:Hint domain-containing protein [Pseudosulfitobacter koreense]MCR8826485.1 Hint domain-containing protein [Pseudosulfitobacter koreense]
MSDTAKPLSPAHSVPVYAARMFTAIDGANMGDALSFAEELELDDVYTLSQMADPQQLAIQVLEDGYEIAAESPTGTPGAALHLDCALTLMSPDGQTTDAIVVVETDATGDVAQIYLLPLASLTPRTDYALVGIDTTKAGEKFAEVACARFTRGTHITMASGAQVPIENLAVGDRVLTRDDGPQPVRWIGQSTVRAVGDFAPICIRADALNNYQDLVVSPDHRLFIYQRSDQLGAGRSELLVKARHLVNGDTVIRQDGGFVDYFQLLFDAHQIIYAEGIAAESTLVDTRTRPTVPEDITSQLLGNGSADHANAGLSGLDVQETLLNRPDAAELLRKASSR